MFNIVITMGGMGSRFTKVGYNQPKYMINAKGKTLFEWSIISLKNFIALENKFIFIVKKVDEAKSFIEEKCEYLGLQNYEIIEIGILTDGQATTALFAEKYWDAGKHLLIYNIDTHIHPDSISASDFNADGWIPCFNAKGASWSFVKLNEQGKAVEVREKQRISDNATIGLYGFSSANLYKELYEEYYSNGSNMEKGEKYVAPLYNQLIKKGGLVTITQIPIEQVQVIGTPEELDSFRSSSYSL